MPSHPFYAKLVDPGFVSKHQSANYGEVAKSISLPNSAGLKQEVRTGAWPPGHPVRERLWKEILKINDNNNATVEHYQEEVERLFGHDRGYVMEPSMNFIDPEFKPTYHLNEEGKSALYRVLWVIHAHQPQITYCPLLWPLCAILLHYMEEEVVYAFLCMLLRHSMPSSDRNDHWRCIPQTRIAAATFSMVLTKLIRKYQQRTVYNSLLNSTQHAENVCSNWHRWIFEDLPFDYAIRFVDCYFVEGIKVFFRISMAIVHFYAAGSGSRRSGDINQAIRQFCKSCRVPCETILHTAFGFRRFSKSYLLRQQNKYEPLASQQGPTVISNSQSGNLTPGVYVSAAGVPQGSILQRSEMQTLLSWLPTRFTTAKPALVFTTAEHGTSTTTFFNRVEPCEETILIIESSNRQVFGAFCSASWEERRKSDRVTYFGTGESFLFTLRPTVAKHPWIGNESGRRMPPNCEMFMAAGPTGLSIGGGSGEAIHIDATLTNGHTSRCDTFNNPPLNDPSHFSIRVLEVLSIS